MKEILYAYRKIVITSVDCSFYKRMNFDDICLLFLWLMMGFTPTRIRIWCKGFLVRKMLSCVKFFLPLPCVKLFALVWFDLFGQILTPRFLSNFLPIFDLAKSSHSPPPIRKLLLKLLVGQSRSKSTHFHERSFHSLEVFANVWFDLFWFPGSQLTSGQWPHHPLSSVKLLIKLFVHRDQVIDSWQH